MLEDLLDQVHRFIYPELRRDSPPMTLGNLAQLASDGTEDLSNTHWQFSVLMRTSTGKRRATWWQRVANVFGIRAVVGHTAVGFLEDDRRLMPLTYVNDDNFPCIAHNTRISYLNSIIVNGLAP